MKRIVDGEIVPSAAASRSGMEELPVGVAGVFETLLVREGAPVFWTEHWARFDAGCRWHGFTPPANAIACEALAHRLIAENAITLGVLRFAAWRGAAGITWRIEASPPRAAMTRGEFRVGWGSGLPDSTPDRAFKHLNRGAWLEALRVARAAGWDEALLCDAAGCVIEGGVTNVFFVRDDALHTPALALGPLPGIMRAQLLALVRARGWTVNEGVFRRDDLGAASEVWLANSLLGVRPVAQLAGLRLPTARPWLERVRAAWRATHDWDPLVVAPPSE